MRNAIVILLLPLFVLFACDAEQKNQTAEKVQVLESTLDEVTQTEMAEPENAESEMTEAEMIQAEAAEAERAEQMEETASVDEVVPMVVEEPMVEESVVEEVMVVEAISGEMIYKKSCIACHASGAANAPKLGDAAAWAPRIKKGMDALYASAMNGLPGTAMMPKGTCAACDEDELNAAVDYMVSKSR